MLDLEYVEDSRAETDMNVVMNDEGGFIELQGTAEAGTFSRAQMDRMVAYAERGIGALVAKQKEALAGS